MVGHAGACHRGAPFARTRWLCPPRGNRVEEVRDKKAEGLNLLHPLKSQVEDGDGFPTGTRLAEIAETTSFSSLFQRVAGSIARPAKWIIRSREVLLLILLAVSCGCGRRFTDI